MPLTVLTDNDVRAVLDTLNRQDILAMHGLLAEALHSYSTGTTSDETECSASNQPERFSIKLKDGSTTLIMPAAADNALGVKMVTLREQCFGSTQRNLPFSESPTSSRPLTPISSKNGRSSISSQPKSPRSSSPDVARTISATSSSASSLRKGSSMSFSSTSNTVPVLDQQSKPEIATTSSTSPKGSMTLLDAAGRPRAILNASCLTAFRTALASCILLKSRKTVHTLTVFGAGLQAYWHIYIAILLRGHEIHHLHVINRDFTRAQQLYMTLGQHNNSAISDVFMNGKIRPSILTPEYGEYTRLLKEHVRAADVMFCCTPSTTPLFPASHLCSTEGRRKARYIAAIGSYKPHMQELPAEVLRQAVESPSEHHGVHLHRQQAGEGGAVVVDTIEGAMRESGEVIKAGIGGQGIVELGELVMLKRSYWAEKAEQEELERTRWETQGTNDKVKKGGHGLAHLFHSGKSKAEQVTKKEEDGGLKDWLERGNLIYKSVGIGLMDVVVGMEIVRLAEERGIGTTIADF